MGALISVIIPTYKRPYNILYRAISSVLTQTYTNIEVIIVDDNHDSFKERKTVERKINEISDERIKFIQHNTNKGACAARNTGIKSSKGEYIAFLDDDDEWLPKKLELQYKKIKESNYGLVYCASNTISMKNDTIINERIRRYKISAWVHDKLILENFIGSTSFVLIKKKVLEEVGIFDVSMKSAQDYELWTRIAKKYKIDYVEEALVNYYVHSGERISNNVDNKISGLEKFNEINMEYLKLNPKALAIRKVKIVPFYRIKYGRKYALKKWYEAFKVWPFDKLVFKTLFKLVIL